MAATIPLRIIETTQISPPAGSVAKTSIPLTFFDVLWVNSPPVQRLFFYPCEVSTVQFAASCLPSLKSSLSITLQSFLPCVGNIRLAPGTSDRYEIHYTEGDSVAFIAAESDDCLDLFGDGPREMSKLRKLVLPLSNNESDDLQPVLAIQATVFPSHGVAIGVTIHHSICDGNGFVNFMRAWSMFCRMSNSVKIDAPPQPIVDRSIIPDNDGSIYASLAKQIWSSKDFKFAEPEESEVVYLASHTLKQEHIHFLKEKFMREAENRGVAVRCSTAVVAYAFIWVGYLKAKSTISESTISEIKDAHCIFAVDHRQRFKPPIPENYLGNCIGPCFIQANAKYLLGPNGFFEACQTISKAFEEVKKVGISDAKDWMTIATEKTVYKPLSCAGSPRFGVYDVDFGWGKPVKVDIVSIAHSGAFALAESREEQGGVEIGLPFTQSEMEIFKNYYISNLR